MIEIVYDKVDWHYDGAFPRALERESAATHIGMLLAWAITRRLVAASHEEDARYDVTAVRSRHMKGSEFLLMICDGVLTAEDLSPEGNAFVHDYYNGNLYIKDYSAALCKDLPTMYDVDDTWENADRVMLMIDRRFEVWRKWR
jgi:hypothetical protein